jgi:hypothetical protein
MLSGLFVQRANPHPVPLGDRRRWTASTLTKTRETIVGAAISGFRRDLDRLAGRLSNGAHVLLYDGHGIEVEAVLEFDQASRRWMALPLWNTI